MPRGRKEQNLAKNHLSAFLDPPQELERVLFHDSLNLIEDAAKSQKSPKALAITFIHHAASKHVLDLRSHESQNQKRKIESFKNLQSKTSSRPILRFPSFKARWIGVKTHPRRLGSRPESAWIHKLNELALVNLVWATLKLAHLGIKIFSFSRMSGGAIRFCVGKACVLIPTKRLTTSNGQQAIDNKQQAIKNTSSSKIKISRHPTPQPKKASLGLPAFELVHGWQRALLSFVCLSLIFVLPLKGLSFYGDLQSTKQIVIEHGRDGLSKLVNAASLVKFSGDLAANEFQGATFSFLEAQRELDRVNATISNLARLHPRTSRELETGRLLISSAEHLARVAAALVSFSETLRQNSNIINKISDLRIKLAQVLPDIIQVNQNLSKIDPRVLGMNEAVLEQMRNTVSVITKMVSDFVNSGDMVLSLLGADSPKRFLLVFQNQNELRPTGGFIGSLAEIKVDRGEISDWRIPLGGPYDLRGGLRVRVAPPAPLRLIAPFWQFQDANWFPDFETSAKKLAWFYERSGGPTVDGVIAINANLIQELFKITGPIAMPEYDKIIMAENFLQETQKAVEVEYDKKLNQPKKFIADLLPRFIDALDEAFSTNYFEVIDVLERALGNKDLQMYFRDELAQTRARSFNWTGDLDNLPVSTDYLMVVNSNISGQKSDARIEQRILHRAEVQTDGTITDNVIILRKHTGIKGELFYGARNVDYLRLYVPMGSVLTEASGFEPPLEHFFKDTTGALPDEDNLRVSGSFAVHRKSGVLINNEFGKTVFGGWVQTDPGEESMVVFKYKLPWKILTNNKTRYYPVKAASGDNLIKYSLFVQKQSGIESEFVSELSLSKTMKPLVFYPNSWRGDGRIFEIKDRIDGDKFYSLLLK